MNLCKKCASLWDHNPKAVSKVVPENKCDYCCHQKQKDVEYEHEEMRLFTNNSPRIRR